MQPCFCHYRRHSSVWHCLQPVAGFVETMSCDTCANFWHPCSQQAGPQHKPELPAGDAEADAQPDKPALGFGQGPETAAPGGEPRSLAEQARLRKAQQVRSSSKCW